MPALNNCSVTTRRTVLVTGATGFVGQAAIERLLANGFEVRAVVRELPSCADRHVKVDWRRIAEISDETDWTEIVSGCDAILHLAARVHVMSEHLSSPLDAYRRTNVAATRCLARAAATAGVRRFLFLSSLKVNGEGRERAYDECDTPSPSDPYAVSKWEAEEELRRIAAATGMDVVILRPPLVYGPGVKANFLRLLQTVSSGMPLPFDSISNRRSLIFLGNLVDAIEVCLSAPAASGQTYLVSDGEDVSTPDLVRAMAFALQRPARLLPCPTILLRMAGKALRQEGTIDRLVGTLQVNSQRIRHELQWTPPYSLAQGMQETANWFRSEIGQ